MPPIVVSAITHSTLWPLGWRRLPEISFAAALAMPMVGTSRDSRGPPVRPSMVGRMPILGSPPLSLIVGARTFMSDTFAIPFLLVESLWDYVSRRRIMPD